MTNRRKELLILFLIVVTNIYSSNACWMEGVSLWAIPQGATIYDTFRGNIFDREIRDIDSIASVSFWEGLNSGPYVSASIIDSRFVLATNDAYEDYEEYETGNSMSVTVNFRCAVGSDVSLMFMIEVQDTNNNAPRFLPSDQLDFTIYTPLPPGSLITGCFDGITVRDIDLTTERIDFEIEENPYFEIIYDADASQTDKEFIAVLKTTTFIRSLPEPITVVISATDVDRTNDPPLTTTATVTIRADTEFELPEEPVFTQTYYFADYVNENQIVLMETISLLNGFDDLVEFNLEGEYAANFQLIPNGNQLSLSVVTPLSLNVIREKHIFLVVRAEREHTSGASATIVVRLPEEIPLEFERAYYEGTIENNVLQNLVLTLTQGYEEADISVQVLGEYSSFFTTNIQENIITLLMQPLTNIIINENNIIVLEIVASSEFSTATTIATLEIIKDDNVTPVFNRPLYEGSYNIDTGLILEEIVFDQGYDDTVELSLEGEYSILFGIRQEGSVYTLTTTAIPPEIYYQQRILLTLQATKPRTVGANAAVVISLPAGLQTEEDVMFDKLVYEGIVQIGTIQHELITIINYDGVTVQLHGEYSSLFVARMTDGVVAVQASGSLNLPDDVTHVVLELHAADARAVLLLSVNQTDVPSPPTVTFTSSSYVLNVEIVQTGLVGRVQATADNGESITYSLDVNNAHLQTRISINNEGELYLSAPANSGVYTFQVIATTVITRAEGTAVVYLTVEAVTICGDNEIVVPPLIILDRDEEEPHNNLVTLNTNQEEICHFTLSNRWPHNQDWLYVDESGLHARSIDREHESIAFMALSQIQVELILHCESDANTRSKRSVRTDWLGPYDYGTSKWILTESIPYNSRRSLVNLIVNDINDNYPIFIGKESEPIAVGYPTKELEERILPRSLAELQATDADIGENAALMYWSAEDVLAVAPTTGFVHVRSGAQLENDQILTVSATDQNGQGLTGDIQLMVKILDLNNILIITVRDAFLNDESQIMAQLSQAVGYELKTLRSVVISDDLIEEEDVLNRQERNTSQTSLLIYVYGLIEREPVLVERLSMDINTNAVIVNIINTISLEDYIENEIIMERDIGFMVATIVLSILLFIIITLIGVWLFIRWRRNRNYDKFSDQNSLASRGESVDQLPKPNTVMPRLNIEELIKSEKRLQDMLSAPVEEVSVEPVTSRREVPVEAIIDLSSPEHSTPIVIQSIDRLKNSEDTDEDEFGESSGTRRKSVVTFNENVEKIIHVEDNDDEDTASSQASYEIYKL